ncbi:MAG: ATP-binding protein [Candidatus Moraniibacteriota bacterium]
MSKLVIFCGIPGSGKTTLSDEVSKRVGIVCLHKDSVKEKFYESMKMSSLEDSKRIGKPSVDVILHLAEEQIKNGIDIMIEAPFNFKEEYDLFRKWEKMYGVDIYSVICSVEESIRNKRSLNRERHEAHHDSEREIISGNYDYSSIPGKKINIETDKNLDELVEIVLKNII